IYQPAWHALLKSLPYFGSVSTLFRWNLIYMVPAILLACRLLDGTRYGARRLAPVLVLVSLASPLVYAPHYMQLYNPGAIVEAWREANASGEVPRVRQLDEALVDGKRASTVGADDALVHGASQIVCNEPLFGYRLENFRFDAVYRGPVFEQRDETFNFYRPECFVFPGANQCSKGDRFPVSNAAGLAQLTDYAPLAFRMPTLQRVSLQVSYVGLILSIAVLFARLVLELEPYVRFRQAKR
ncbi:MAG TPA: hypothetical protein VJ998_01520, partial [Pseudomonadales bacterium]|nr:hypothetical protein [Pseudomonadales bacterium]